MNLAVEAARLAGVDQPLVITGKAGWGEAEAGGHVKAVGYVDAESLSALYSAAGLYLAPSLHEGFGIPIVEAFTCGCPVICSSGGALPEVAADAAIVMNTWEPAAWAEAIKNALHDSSKLESLRARGLRRATSFSWESMAANTIEVYKRVIA